MKAQVQGKSPHETTVRRVIEQWRAELKRVEMEAWDAGGRWKAEAAEAVARVEAEVARVDARRVKVEAGVARVEAEAGALAKAAEAAAGRTMEAAVAAVEARAAAEAQAVEARAAADVAKKAMAEVHRRSDAVAHGRLVVLATRLAAWEARLSTREVRLAAGGGAAGGAAGSDNQ